MYGIYSNRGLPQIEADSNTSRNIRASPSGLNDPIFKKLFKKWGVWTKLD